MYMETYSDNPPADLVAMVINTQKGDITIHCDTGEVEYPDSLSDAAKEFWLALEEAYPFLFAGKTGE